LSQPLPIIKASRSRRKWLALPDDSYRKSVLRFWDSLFVVLLCWTYVSVNPSQELTMAN
jgi:hypothetical protein